MSQNSEVIVKGNSHNKYDPACMVWGALSHQTGPVQFSGVRAMVPMPWLNFHEGMCAARQNWRTGTSHLLHTYRMSSSMLAPLTHIRADTEDLCT